VTHYRQDLLLADRTPPSGSTVFVSKGINTMLKQHLHIFRRALIGLEPLIGNAIWSGVAWAAVLLHLYGFLAAIVVFKILNELTIIQHGQGLE
jgi:hypothetical protein